MPEFSIKFSANDAGLGKELASVKSELKKTEQQAKATGAAIERADTAATQKREQNAAKASQRLAQQSRERRRAAFEEMAVEERIQQLQARRARVEAYLAKAQGSRRDALRVSRGEIDAQLAQLGGAQSTAGARRIQRAGQVIGPFIPGSERFFRVIAAGAARFGAGTVLAGATGLGVAAAGVIGARRLSRSLQQREANISASGLSADEFSRMEQAAAKAKLPVDDLVEALRKLREEQGDAALAGGKLLATLTRLGINAADFREAVPDNRTFARAATSVGGEAVDAAVNIYGGALKETFKPLISLFNLVTGQVVSKGFRGVQDIYADSDAAAGSAVGLQRELAVRRERIALERLARGELLPQDEETFSEKKERVMAERRLMEEKQKELVNVRTQNDQAADEIAFDKLSISAKRKRLEIDLAAAKRAEADAPTELRKEMARKDRLEIVRKIAGLGKPEEVAKTGVPLGAPTSLERIGLFSGNGSQINILQQQVIQLQQIQRKLDEVKQAVKDEI